jgi:hypothetical protein
VHGLLGIGHPQKVEHHRQPFAEILVEAQHPPGDLVARGLWWVLLGDPEVATNEREYRKPRHRLPIGHTVPLVDLDLSRAAALHELVAKAALPRARLGDHADDLRVPRDRLLERRLESGHLLLPADKLREAARTGHVDARPHSAQTLELEDVQWIGQPFDAGLPQVSKLKVAGDELRRVPGEEHLSRIGHLLHPRGETDSVALRHVVHP